MVKANPPATIPATIKLLPDVAARPLLAVMVMPRFASKLSTPMDCKLPPPKLMDAGVVLAGTGPKLFSAEMLKIPAEMVVGPEY